jgi:signal peptidase II
MKIRIIKTVFILFVLVSNVGCDQISKSIVRQRIGDQQEFRFLNDHLTLMKIENSGAFLSLGESLPLPVKLIILVICPSLLLAWAIIFVLTKQNLSTKTFVGVGFIIGGGIGNLYDRVVHGSVTDFLHIDFGFFQTGIFNMADVSIMVGVGFALLGLYERNKQPATTL